MKFFLALFLAVALTFPAHAQNKAVAPEDAPIEDVAPGESAATAPPQVHPTQAHESHTNAPQITTAPATATTNPDASDDAGITVPAWWNVPASFAPGFMQGALGAGLVVALLCGYLSVFVVLKRIAFVGVALSQMCSAGVALGFLLGFSPIIGALLLMIVGVALFAFSPDPRRVPRESYIGAVYAVAGACGVLLVAVNASGESRMLDLLQGDILAGDASGLHWLIGVYAVLALAHVAFQKEWVLVSFDREAANTLGFPAPRWDFFLFLTIGIAIALANRTVGALLTSALLILPGATALLLCSRLRAALWLAPLLTIIPVILGLHTSFVSTENAPPSALITAILFVLFVAALGWRTTRARFQRT
ncbi:manganese transport system membrane protein MntB [Abditibacteriota bacterium]|nr:manganese transport system membrane protein MntB [Abditibacteriota bacterium]